MNYYLAVFQKYAQFNGRSQRAEYWYFSLFNFLIILGINLLNIFLYPRLGINLGFIGFIYSLAVVIPGSAVTIRRLHDIDKSGWMILISFIPIIGAIWLLILTIRDSEPGDNKYGPNPKGVAKTPTPTV